MQHNFIYGSCADVTLAGATVTPPTAQVNLVQLPPQFTNVTVVNNTNAGTLCTPSLQVTDSTVVYDMVTPGTYNNFHDYDVALRANKSIFPTFGNELVITASDAATNNAFGNAVALSGDGSVLAVGATAASYINVGFGADTVYLFRRVHNSWVQIQEIQSPLLAASLLSGFGTSVALSYDGSVLVIGAPGTTAPLTGNPYFLGNVYIYTLSPTNSLCTLSQTISGQLGFGTGVDVSATGQYVAIGTNVIANETRDTVSVLIYERQNTCANTQEPWALQAQLIPTVNGAPFINEPVVPLLLFFKHLALSADGATAALGCTNSTGDGTAFLFQQTGSAWQQAQIIIAPGSEASFGSAIALSATGKYLAVGEFFSSNALYIYARRGTSWELETTFNSGDTTFRANSLAFSADGTVLAAGHYAASAGSGQISLFLRGPNNHWNYITTWLGAASNNFLGFSCACSADGTIIAAGAPQANGVPGIGYAILLRSIGSTIPNDTVVSGSLCVYHRTTVDSNLKVAGNIHL